MCLLGARITVISARSGIVGIGVSVFYSRSQGLCVQYMQCCRQLFVTKLVPPP